MHNLELGWYSVMRPIKSSLVGSDNLSMIGSSILVQTNCIVHVCCEWCPSPSRLTYQGTACHLVKEVNRFVAHGEVVPMTAVLRRGWVAAMVLVVVLSGIRWLSEIRAPGIQY